MVSVVSVCHVVVVVFVFGALESSVTIIYPRFDQSSAGGFDDLDGLLCVQRGLKFEPGRNKAVIFTAVIKPELLSYSSGSALRNFN